MNKKRSLARIALIVCPILAVWALYSLLTPNGLYANNMRIALAGFVALMAHGCYRAWKHLHKENELSEVEETERKLQHVQSLSGFLSVFFNPKDMRFRTMASIFIILCIGDTKAFWFFLGLLIASKTALFIQYYRYWKAYQKLSIANAQHEALIEKMRFLADCPSTYIAPTKSEDVSNMFAEARQRGQKEGFIPILLYVDEYLYSSILTTLGINEDEDVDIDKIRVKRKELIAKASSEDGKKWLDNRLQEIKNSIQEEKDSQNTIKQLWGEPTNEASSQLTLFAFDEETTKHLLLAEVPVTEAWQLLAWFPFGDWNDCPPCEDIINISKYWYDTYNAIPACLSCDSIEITVDKPIDEELSLALAEKQYAFCPDVVEQGLETIQALADYLRKSTVWFFWWD